MIDRELPPYAADCFAIVNGSVCWASEAGYADAVSRWRDVDRRVAAFLSKKRLPFDAPCGFIRVAGGGDLIRFSGLNLLSRDVRFALEHGGAWPWDCGADRGADRGVSVLGARECAVIAETWAIVDGAITWRIGVHESREAGSVATGRPVYGWNDAALTRRGVCYLASDVRRVLEW